ncbi:MAG: DUF2255 family protein [Chloroflexota bacterium]|nr:DUF2255 family protein [Chloroflexota bacterium]
MASSFDHDLLERLRTIEEVEIETSAPGGGSPHRAIIWVVVDEHDRVLIRSFRGPSGRWYREAIANPEVALHFDAVALAATALPARDPARIAACSHGFLAKYSDQRSTMAMLTPENLPTTLELLPR